MDSQSLFPYQIKTKVLEYDPNAKVVLFGSRARGDFRNDSDWDFLVLTSEAMPKEKQHKLLDEVFDLELLSEQVISLLIREVAYWQKMENALIYKNIQREGVVI